MPLRVLVVDDQADVMRMLVQFLVLEGYDVVGETDFEPARRYIDETPPDVLVTDVRLGPYNGLQLVLHMRLARPDAPIVVLSAWDDAMLRQESARLGAQYRTKPISRMELGQAIASAKQGRPPSPLEGGRLVNE
jgi:two-component system response regulator GlrR